MSARKPAPDPPVHLRAIGRNEWEQVWRRVVADPAIKLVGWTAASWGDPDGTRIFPGAKNLAATTCLTETTVKKALAVIREAGLMWRHVEGSRHGRQGVADEYRLTVPSDVTGLPMLTPEYEAAGTGRLRTRDLRTRDLRTGTGDLRHPEQVNSDHPTTTGPLHSPLHYESRSFYAADVEGTQTPAGNVETPDLIDGDAPGPAPAAPAPEPASTEGPDPITVLRSRTAALVARYERGETTSRDPSRDGPVTERRSA